MVSLIISDDKDWARINIIVIILIYFILLLIGIFTFSIFY